MEPQRLPQTAQVASQEGKWLGEYNYGSVASQGDNTPSSGPRLLLSTLLSFCRRCLAHRKFCAFMHCWR